MTFLQLVLEQFEREFGAPTRRTAKVFEWAVSSNLSAVIQLDQPASGEAALVWLPYPPDDGLVPEGALEYPAEAGRHSNTYAAAGLKKGLPAIRLTISTRAELSQAIAYIKSAQDYSRKAEIVEHSQAPAARGHLIRSFVTRVMILFDAARNLILPRAIKTDNPQKPCSSLSKKLVASVDRLPEPKPVAPRREAIPRAVQREVWQRDGGRCVECSTREKLCFDHIIPFSRGGGNTIRNLQLLCERCNTSKGNRI